jgi:phosphomethylpyrimidine synthase
MTTQLEYARQGIITEEMKTEALSEGLSEMFIKDHVAKGEIVIPCNPQRKNQKITGIGTGLRTKVNASIGTSSDICDINLEVLKAQAAEQEGAESHVTT